MILELYYRTYYCSIIFETLFSKPEKAANSYQSPSAEGLKAVAADRTGKAESDDGKWFEAGLDLVRKSKLAVVLLAGGQESVLNNNLEKILETTGGWL